MENFYKILLLVVFVSGFCIVSGNTALAQMAPQVRTDSATYISNYQANLNAYLFLNNSTYSYIYFDWGATTNYGSQTPRQIVSYTGSFFQQIANLNSGTTYHYRAVVTNNYGTYYGQDMIFTTSGASSGAYYGNSALVISKKVINLTNGNLNWQPSVNANPGDILSFAITMQAGNYDVHNIVVTDLLPANLVYNGNLTVNASLNYGNPANGITIGTIPANGVAVVSFQAKVAPASNFSYGNTTITNTATVSSAETGSQTVSASVLLNNTSIAGATIIDTGITNNPIRDSFLFPIALIILMSWLYFTGRIYRFADWLGARL